MKKWIALLLCLTMLLPLGLVPASAEDAGSRAPKKTGEPVVKSGSPESAFADGENSLIVFVTGIGQSFSYYFNDSYLEDGAFPQGTLQDYDNYAPLVAEGKYDAYWNLFASNYENTLKDKDAQKAVVRVVSQLLLTLFFRRNMVKEDAARELVRQLFHSNLVDENGNSDPHVVTPRYIMPVSDYPYITDENGEYYSEAKRRFYTSIPCQEVAREMLGENYEDYLYCYNFKPFSYTSQNVEGLHDFIETIVADNKVGAQKVVLVPMSMGASVVSAYLAKYPNVEDNHVRRVVSIVGCWKGSDLVYDLIMKNYAENSPDLLYNGIVADMVGEPWGYVVNMALRLFSKPALRSFIDEALTVFVEELFFDAPSLCALVPDDKYEEVRPLIKSEAVRAEADAYHEAQASVRERLAALEAQGVTFSFIAGYGLPYGAITSDYKAFGFMRSAATTNSDEIINVESTVPGTVSVAYNEQFTDTAGRILSPDGSLDIAGAYYKDSAWFFKNQKHELENNNTAIGLAIRLALGQIKTVADCDNLEEDGVYYPQFNEARDVKRLTRDELPLLEAYLANGGTLTAAQQALYDEALAMVRRTVNDQNADNELMERFSAMMVDLGLEEAPKGPSKTDAVLSRVLSRANDFTARTVGSKGYLDLPACD